ncbi:MAG: HDIG domain-containing protein [Victivallaceae bacterium]|nr:HDIG domain-containing protein [Victivallaceae bacterium]
MLDGIKKIIAAFLARREMKRKGLISAHGSASLSSMGEFLDHSPAPRIFTLIAVWVACSVMLSLASQHQFADFRNLVVGQEAPRTVVAKFEFTCPDYEQRGNAAKTAAEEQPDCFLVNVPESQRIKGELRKFFESAAAKTAVADSKPSALEKAAAALYNHPDKLFDAFENTEDLTFQRGVIGMEDKNSRKLGKSIRVIDASRRRREAKPVTDLPDPAQAAQLLAAAALESYPDGSAKTELQTSLAAEIEKMIGPQGNLVFSKAETDEELADVLRRMPKPTTTYNRGALLVRRGDRVNEYTCQLVSEYTRQEEAGRSVSEEWRMLFRHLVSTLVLVIFAAFYLYHLHPELVKSSKRISLIGLVVCLSIFANYLVIRYFYFMVSESRNLPADFVLNAVPVALVSVIIAVIFGYRASLCAGFFVASITAMMLVPERAFEQALKGMLICSLAGLAVRSATNYRSYFMRTVLSIFPLVLLLNLNLFRGSVEPRAEELASYCALSLAGAIATGFLALAVIFFCELVFNVSTNMALMVLCDYNHPLLERLKREAPGTFFHSLMVATLAEDAARAIGANPLKAKAGALFHDIGKLSMPHYFTENNLESANQHLALNPQMSSIIIRDHVKEGLALARQYRMCRTVRDAISQHHGNDLVHFFYEKARRLQGENGAPVLETQFRYDGTPPSDREMAIISLADACEAASRSLDKPSAAALEAIVNEIFLGRYRDGQLKRANLTLADLEKIRQSFINTLLSMKHGRIAYRTGE